MPPAALVRMSVGTPRRAEDAGGKRHRPQVVALVEMRAARQRRNPLAGERADDQLPGMADDGRRRPVRDIAVMK